MPDITPDQTPTTPGQLLAGPPPNTSNMPLNARAGQPPSLPGPQAPQQQPAQPTPERAVAAKHHALGRAASFLFGAEVNPDTGEPVKQKPGAIFRSLLAGALLGGAIGSEGNAGGGKVGGFLGGLGRGAVGVEQQAYQRRQQAQQEAQTNAQHKQEMTLEQQKFDEEKMQHASTLEHWNLENLARGREADYRDREQFEKENEIDLNVQKWAVDNGAFVAPSIPQNGVPGNGPDMMKAMTKNPVAFNPPAGVGRLIVKKYDFDNLDHDTKNGWTEDAKPARRNEESVAPVVIVGKVMASRLTSFCARSKAANISVLNLLGGAAGMEKETFSATTFTSGSLMNTARVSRNFPRSSSGSARTSRVASAEGGMTLDL